MGYPQSSPAAFEGRSKVLVRSMYIAASIDTLTLRKARNLTDPSLTLKTGRAQLWRLPLTLEVGRDGRAIVFLYGAIVFFNVEPIEETAFLKVISTLAQFPDEVPIVEEMELSLAEEGRVGIEGDTLLVTDFKLPTLQVVAEVLARSIVLERFEGRAGITLDNLQAMAVGLSRGHTRPIRLHDLVKNLGNVLVDEAELLGRIAIIDKPVALWNHPDLEPLYKRLSDEFEIARRYEATLAKLNLINRTIQTSVDLLQYRRSSYLEWGVAIIILIGTVLTLFDIIKHLS